MQHVVNIYNHLTEILLNKKPSVFRALFYSKMCLFVREGLNFISLFATQDPGLYRVILTSEKRNAVSLNRAKRPAVEALV